MIIYIRHLRIGIAQQKVGKVKKECENYNSTDVLFYSASRITKDALSLQKGDKIVLTGGVTNGQTGNTNLIKVDVI